METVQEPTIFLLTPKEKIESFVDRINTLNLPFGGKFEAEIGKAAVWVTYTAAEGGLKITKHPSFEQIVQYNDILAAVNEVCREILCGILTSCIIGEEKE